jgi:geranylgeranyl pyrophosphate synthase
MRASGSLDHARQTAADLVAEAKSALSSVPESAPKRLLMTMADAVISRDA